MQGDRPGYWAPAPNTVRIRRWDIGPAHVVWGAVRFMDQPDQAKDRPVLVVGRQPGVFLVLTLTTKPKRPEQADWFPLGTGGWDRERRPSWARLHPWYRMVDADVRRPGGVVARPEFDALRRVLVERYGWSFPNG